MVGVLEKKGSFRFDIRRHTWDFLDWKFLSFGKIS